MGVVRSHNKSTSSINLDELDGNFKYGNHKGSHKVNNISNTF